MTELAPRRPSRRRRGVLLAVIGIIALVVLAGVWLGVRGFMAKSELEAAVADAGAVRQVLDGGDLDASRAALTELAEHSGTASSLMGDPVWRIAELIPGIGPNMAAARIAAQHAHGLSATVALPLIDTVDRVAADSTSIADLAALRDAQPALRAAVDATRAAADDLASVNTDAIIAQLSDGVTQLRDVTADVQPLVEAAANAAELLPAMLGVDEERTILVMVQNNAELRTGGGITGSFIEITSNDGDLAIVAQADSSEFPEHPPAGIEVPASTSQLYGVGIADWVQNMSMTPEFPVTAQLASQWWDSLTGTTPDAVVSVDPIVIAALVQAHGPIDTVIGEINQDNLVEQLLVMPYLEFSREEQTAVFDEVAQAIFTQVLTGGTDFRTLVSALTAPIEEGRISVWSAHADEQEVLGSSILGGPAARQQLAGDHAFAVYLNDATGGKMDSFLEVEVSAGSTQCRTDSNVDATVAVKLTSHAPADAAHFSQWLTGGGISGTPAGDIATIVTVSAPVGSFFGAVTLDDADVAPVTLDDAGFPVSATSVTLSPGESKTAVFRFVTPDPGVDLEVLHTPTLHGVPVESFVPDCP